MSCRRDWLADETGCGTVLPSDGDSTAEAVVRTLAVTDAVRKWVRAPVGATTSCASVGAKSGRRVRTDPLISSTRYSARLRIESAAPILANSSETRKYS